MGKKKKSEAPNRSALGLFYPKGHEKPFYWEILERQTNGIPAARPQHE